ncbi:antibiotic biosynthesis monooxygenase family protein [Thalassotalea euphylliae]|uniref:antibiotic biosynthesis monooxygenase family protein n=1 Tax=Thalassotalea euphylliae TaxID=1655234 RepID=UPI00364358EF
MFVVIFRAKVVEFTPEYSELAATLRQLAFDKYNCIDFSAVTEGKDEIAVSYWHTLEDIKAWKTDTTHKYAQSKGQKHWYSDYQVDICEINRTYQQGEHFGESISAT